MKAIEFEALSRKLLQLTQKTRDADKLLKIACELLDAEVGVLLRCRVGENAGPVELEAIYPYHYRQETKDEIEILRAWYASHDLPQETEGFSKEEPIALRSQEFSDALVAFDDGLLNKTGYRYELLLLKKLSNTVLYRSYHCWAAASLLRSFEFFLFQGIFKEETELKEQCALSASTEALAGKEWGDVEKITQNMDSKKRWLLYTLWTAYQVRRRKSGKRLSEPIDRALESEKESPLKVCPKVIRYLLDRSDPHEDNLFEELKTNFDRVKSPPWSEVDFESQLWSQLTLLVLEHGWRDLLNVASRGDWEPASKMPTDPQKTENKNASQTKRPLSELIDLTRAVCIRMLPSISSGKKASDGRNSSNLNDEGLELGQRFLRVYLAVELFKPKSRLAQLYLNHEKVSEHRDAPPELKRLFVRNLSRFILSVIVLIQEQLEIYTSPRNISKTEALDSLLYLIDRYAHVELGVHERFDIRRHLARQIGTEVHHHLTRPHYRDHLLHVIDVFLLGHILLNTRFCWLEGEIRSFLEHLCILASCTTSPVDLLIRKREWTKNWALASLLHDIGYQLGHGRSLTENPEIWRKYFALPDPVDCPWLQVPSNERGDSSQNIFKDLLAFVENLVNQTIESKDFAGCLPNPDNNSLKDHGVLSALRILQILFHSVSKNSFEENGGQVKIPGQYRHALHAIAHHNLSHKTVSIGDFPLTCLLRLCDELQEWGRRRINLEKVVKQLYLDIQQGYLEELPSYQMLNSFKANLNLAPSPASGMPETMKINVSGTKPELNFLLCYNDPIDAQFDPTMTTLCKAFNLQHLGMSIRDEGLRDLTIRIELRFPIPPEYGELTEYDVYGLFTDEARSLPLLQQFDEIEKAESGLIRLTTNRIANTKALREESFGIIMSRLSDSVHRHGWLERDPGQLFDQFIEFKKKVIARHVKKS